MTDCKVQYCSGRRATWITRMSYNAVASLYTLNEDARLRESKPGKVFFFFWFHWLEITHHLGIPCMHLILLCTFFEYLLFYPTAWPCLPDEELSGCGLLPCCYYHHSSGISHKTDEDALLMNYLRYFVVSGCVLEMHIRWGWIFLKLQTTWKLARHIQNDTRACKRTKFSFFLPSAL